MNNELSPREKELKALMEDPKLLNAGEFNNYGFYGKKLGMSRTQARQVYISMVAKGHAPKLPVMEGK